MKFFLRAESFYNFSSEVDRLINEDDFWSLRGAYGGSLHECSHGEAFLKLVKNRFTDHGLYILDEPEAALSPQRQMSLLCLIDELAKKGSQFIIATHSPILISYRDGKILDLNDNFKEVEYKDTDIYKLLVELVDKNISFVMWYDEFWESIDLFSDIKEILKVCYEQILDKSGMCEVYIWYNGTKTMEDANNNS